jgi:cyclophilin family peptidyl-prolyl cis-trans isomerase
MRRTATLLRGSKGHGWYSRFMEQGPEAFSRKASPTPFDWSAGNVKRPRAYFNIAIDDKPEGRIVIELADDIVPKTVKNFQLLCEGKGSFHYSGTKIHRLFKGIALMGGDVEFNDGTGGHAQSPQRYIEDENFIIPHTSRGLVSMASVGRDTGASQFYISLGQNYHMNGYCVVFGRVVEGDSVLAAIEKVFTVRGSPARDIRISGSGML